MGQRKSHSGTGGARAKAHVLVVEDDTDGRVALGRLLELAGCDVELAATGERAIQLALQHAPAIALIDISLPDVDGCEVARQIRSGLANRGRAHPKPVLVALTGHADPADRKRADQAGFDHYLVKPADPQRLLELVASASRPCSV